MKRIFPPLLATSLVICGLTLSTPAQSADGVWIGFNFYKGSTNTRFTPKRNVIFLIKNGNAHVFTKSVKPNRKGTTWATNELRAKDVPKSATACVLQTTANGKASPKNVMCLKPGELKKALAAKEKAKADRYVIEVVLK